MPADIIFFRNQSSPHHLDKFIDYYGSGNSYPDVKKVPYVPLYDIKFNNNYESYGGVGDGYYSEIPYNSCKSQYYPSSIVETKKEPLFYKRTLYQPPAHLFEPLGASSKPSYFLPPVSRSGTPTFNTTAQPSYVHLGSSKPKTALDDSIDKFLNSCIYNYPPHNTSGIGNPFNVTNASSNSTGYFPWCHYYPYSSSGLLLPYSSGRSTYPYYSNSYASLIGRSTRRADDYDDYDPLIRKVPKSRSYYSNDDLHLDTGMSGYASKYYGGYPGPRSSFKTEYLTAAPSSVPYQYLARSLNDVTSLIPKINSTFDDSFNLRLGADTPSYYPISKHNNYMVYYPYSRYIDSHYPLSTYKRDRKSYFDLAPHEV